MAWLHHSAVFDPDQLPGPVVGIHAQLGRHDSGPHCHAMGQLLFTSQGCVRIELDAPALLCLLPPTRAAWIPPGRVHRARMHECVDYRSVYFAVEHFPRLPDQVQVLSVGPLLRELLERLARAPFDTDWRSGKAAHLAALCVEEIADAGHEPMVLPMPTDRRLVRHLCEAQSLPPTLQQLAGEVGASARTITRLLRRDTGLSYQQWRQQWRLVRAVELLASQWRLSDVALELGFASDSAFIAFFRGMTGVTPGMYCR